MRVVCDGVVKRFEEPGGVERSVLDGLSLTCEAGSTTVVTGPSGSGKSTLLNVISGLYLPDGGTVSVGDTRLDTLAEGARDRFRAENIGYVFQTFNLLTPLTVLQNLVLPAAMAGRSEGGRTDRARVVLDELGLAETADKMPYQLSVGQRQRVAVARAVLDRPAVLLADEPTANLDDAAAAAVAGAMTGLVTGGSTLIVATHDPKLRSAPGAHLFDVVSGEAREVAR